MEGEAMKRSPSPMIDIENINLAAEALESHSKTLKREALQESGRLNDYKMERAIKAERLAKKIKALIE
jgi:hypothetical protein